MSEENFAVPDEYLVSVFGDRPDMVQHPPHYTAGSVECIDALESMVMGYQDTVQAVWHGRRSSISGGLRSKEIKHRTWTKHCFI